MGGERRASLITAEMKSKVDKRWDMFWAGGISDAKKAEAKMTDLVFIKRFHDLSTLDAPNGKLPLQRLDGIASRLGSSQFPVAISLSI